VYHNAVTPSAVALVDADEVARAVLSACVYLFDKLVVGIARPLSRTGSCPWESHRWLSIGLRRERKAYLDLFLRYDACSGRVRDAKGCVR